MVSSIRGAKVNKTGIRGFHRLNWKWKVQFKYCKDFHAIPPLSFLSVIFADFTVCLQFTGTKVVDEEKEAF